MCGRKNCMFSMKISKVELEATPPSIFVGRFGYPKVFAGPMFSPSDNPEFYDSPEKWTGNIEDVVKLRMKVARGMKPVDVKAPANPDKYILELQEAVSSIKPLELETKISKLDLKPKFDTIVKPAGMSIKIDDFKLETNPKIPDKVEKLYYDDLKAEESVYYLFKHGFSDYYIQKIMSAGMLGELKNRKLVPTRWSVTAVHEIIARKLKREILDYKEINDVLMYHFEHFGNKFFVVFYPSNLSFELVEIWGNWVGRDREYIKNKKRYSNLSGGYYAARLPVFQYLSKLKRKAGILVVREVTPSYTVPLGVWVVEEGIKRALREKPIKFDSFSEAVSHIKNIKFSRQLTLSDF